MKYPVYSTRTVYPEDIECVWSPQNNKGGIYIGNLEASQNLQTLKKYGIKAVLTAARDIQLRHPKSQIPHHLHIPGEDHERFDLAQYFDQSLKFIDSKLKQTNILVHCMAGISRSVTLVLAYLMKHHRMTYDQAFNTVKRKRRIINPNNGFIKQLKNFEKHLQFQNQAMRRSYDHFREQTERQKTSELRKSISPNLQTRQALHSSIRREAYPLHQNNNARYSTVDQQREPIQDAKYAFNTKYQIPIKHTKNPESSYGSYSDMNKELDQKIATIRKKYMEATDLLNRHKSVNKNIRLNSTTYFNNFNEGAANKSLWTEDLMTLDYPSLRKVVSNNQQVRQSRTSSYAHYRNPATTGYLYYQYDF